MAQEVCSTYVLLWTNSFRFEIFAVIFCPRSLITGPIVSFGLVMCHVSVGMIIWLMEPGNTVRCLYL